MPGHGGWNAIAGGQTAIVGSANLCHNRLCPFFLKKIGRRWENTQGKASLGLSLLARSNESSWQGYGNRKTIGFGMGDGVGTEKLCMCKLFACYVGIVSTVAECMLQCRSGMLDCFWEIPAALPNL